jgi:3-oxoadipate enol-lactonase
MVAGLIIADPDLEPAWKAKWQRWDPQRLLAAGEALLDRDDITDRLPELAMPVLLVHGAEDAAIPVARAYEICDAVDDCRGVVEVEGAAHASNLTHPHVVNPAIRSFLEGLPA